ncbi:MAG: hypothetical protein WC758_07795 [Candidatus Woesearchaeota archaeon]|jgi:hypothetical protein
MKKQGKSDNKVIVGIVVALLLIGLVYYVSISQKQTPKAVDFSDTTSEKGGTSVGLVFENGDRGTMADVFYKISGSAAPFSIIRGATTVSCTSNAICTSRCPVGDTICNTYIKCYDSKCGYSQVTAMYLNTSVLNSGQAILNVTFDTATTNPVSTAFNTAYLSQIGKSVILNAGQSYNFGSADIPLSSYSTGALTTFTSGVYAINQYTGARIPATGSQTSNVGMIIYLDPVSGLTVTISGLGGL